MSIKNKLFSYRNLFIFWSIIICFVLYYPQLPGLEEEIFGLDKFVHFFLFFIFAVLFFNLGTDKKKQYKNLIFLSILVPITSEIIQIPIPGREFSIYDIVANFLGFLSALVFFYKK
jgi:VanZ family protein